jgi:hyperosmotically inducible protein
MTLRRSIGTLVLGAALALLSVAIAHNASPAQKSSKMKGAGSKTGKAGKSGQKGGKKGKGGGVAVADTAATDSWITMTIKGDFVNESTLKGSDIDVETKDNVVTLNGTVASEAGKARAEEIAKQTQGVTKVVDNLTIKR